MIKSVLVYEWEIMALIMEVAEFIARLDWDLDREIGIQNSEEESRVVLWMSSAVSTTGLTIYDGVSKN